MQPYYQDEWITLYNGDCREILPTFPDKSFDLCLTDPPYGIGMDTSVHANLGRMQYEKIIGDDARFDPSFLFRLECEFILWGANNYHHSLPMSGGWIVWDKRSPDGSSDNVFGWSFELAWCSRERYGKMLRVQHGGYLNDDSSGRRVHPTQKPIRLMSMCIEEFSPASIIDPFAGSCTTGVAAKKLKRKCTLIEIEEKYCEIGAKRLNSPIPLFEQPEQLELT